MSRYVDFYLIGELVDSHGNVHYEDLKNLPTADVVEKNSPYVLELRRALSVTLDQLERQRGEWKICDAKPPTWWYECSVCGNAGNIEYNYCPNCGADMRGKDDDN